MGDVIEKVTLALMVMLLVVVLILKDEEIKELKKNQVEIIKDSIL